MHLLGGANWWLPRWLDRRLPRISVEPPECRAAHERLAAATDAEVADVLEDELEKGRQQDVRDIPG
jgi:RND superfamily putative drug exporter